MKNLLAAIVAACFAVISTQVLAAEAKKDTGSAGAAASASAKLEKPANVTQEAWDKMSEAEKKKAVEAAQSQASKSATKKEKKGGC